MTNRSSTCRFIFWLSLGVIGLKAQVFSEGFSADRQLMPMQPFADVAPNGALQIQRRLGTLSTDDGLPLPVFLEFQPDRNTASPFFHYGWNVSLDAAIVQLDERTFLVQEPDGSYRPLRRNRANPKLLGREGSYHAIIEDNKITVFPGSGRKLNYINGRIESIDFSNGKKWRYYRSPTSLQIKQDGTPIVNIQKGTRDNDPTTISLAKERYAIKFGECPIVGRVAEQNVVLSKGRSIQEIQGPQGTVQYSYSLTQDVVPLIFERQPDGGESTFSWDVTSGQALRINDASFSVEKISEHYLDSPKITKKEGGHISEWSSLPSRGQERTVIDGVETLTEVFVQSQLQGRLRKIVESRKGEKPSEQRFLYDQDGNLIGINSPDGILRIQDGNIIRNDKKP